MADKDDEIRLVNIMKAIDNFPSIVRRKERAFREKEKRLRAFLPFTRELRKTLEKQKREEGKK